jgi:hypothetical protein
VTEAVECWKKNMGENLAMAGAALSAIGSALLMGLTWGGADNLTDLFRSPSPEEQIKQENYEKFMRALNREMQAREAEFRRQQDSIWGKGTERR